MKCWTVALHLCLLALLATEAGAQTRVERHRSCSATGNGHFATFDGYRFDKYVPGWWLLTDSADEQAFRVEIDAHPMMDGKVTIYTRAAVRCGENVIATEAEGLVVALDGQEVHDQETAFGPGGEHLLTVGSDQVGIDCGDHTVRLNRYVWQQVAGLNITATKAYYLRDGEPTKGLCGEFDGDSNDGPMGGNYEPIEAFAVLVEESLFAQAAPPVEEIPGTIYTHHGTLEFDGTNNVWLDGPFALTPNFYLSAEIRVDESEQWNHLIEIGSHEYEWNGPLRFEVGHEGEWYVSVGDGAGFKEFYKQGQWTYGEWVKVEVEYRGGAIRLWENGVYLGVQQADINVTSVSGELNLGNFARGGRHFRGAMRNILIRAID